MESEGRYWGRPRRLDEAQVVRVLQLRRAGRSLSQIAAMLKVPRSTVHRPMRRSASFTA